jgi:ubiquinone/menaquinone biosynthesis C-methylase UbiE
MPASLAADGTEQLRYLTVEQARRTYDRIGRIQDLQAIYEHRAIRELLAHADFKHAHAVFELGFGTGALAKRLLEHHLPADCRYVGLELSPRMHRLATQRLRAFGARVDLRLGDGSLPLPFPPGEFDRFLATYVLDLMSPEHIARVLDEAQRLLAPDGLLCLISLTHGQGTVGRSIDRAWSWLWSKRPALVGGCRALQLSAYFPEDWKPEHNAVVSSAGTSSDVLIARRRSR